MPIKVGFVSLGCPKNQIDTEHMLHSLKESEEFEIVGNKNLADVVIINTCGFIKAAKQEAIDVILEFIEMKKTTTKHIIVTGCLAERYKEQIFQNFPEIDAVLGIGSQDILKQTIKNCLKNKKIQHFNKINCNSLNQKRILTTPSHYAYLKIAEGCNNFCSYCAIPLIRGRYVSRSLEDILKEAKWLETKNVKELILIAQDTTYYGLDLYKKFSLDVLLKEISKLNFKWIRFLYAYPEKINDSLIETVATAKNIIPYFDMPIQHIDDTILKAMNRKTNAKQIITTIEKIRKNIKDATIRTSLIVGFPGETKAQFENLLNFVKETKFDRLGCFCYSKEEGTKAALLKNQIDEKTKEIRRKLIYKTSEEIIIKKSLSEINKTISVIVDYKKQDDIYMGRKKKDAPDVDCVVFFKSKKPLQNGDIVNVKIIKTKDIDLIGEAI